MKNWIIISVLMGLLSMFLANTAIGHAAIVWAYVEKDQVHVEAFYPSGARIQNAKIVVVDPEGKTIQEGKTDSKGNYSYKPLSKDSQTIVVVAGESHVGDFELSAEDLSKIDFEK